MLEAFLVKEVNKKEKAELYLHTWTGTKQDFQLALEWWVQSPKNASSGPVLEYLIMVNYQNPSTIMKE